MYAVKDWRTGRWRPATKLEFYLYNGVESCLASAYFLSSILVYAMLFVGGLMSIGLLVKR